VEKPFHLIPVRREGGVSFVRTADLLCNIPVQIIKEQVTQPAKKAAKKAPPCLSMLPGT
jgi:hypothetical protein